jgi:hypothetical protein
VLASKNLGWRLNRDKAEFSGVSEITQYRKILPATAG